MSRNSAHSDDKVTVLPQFMKDENAHIDLPDEENSWLSNNLHKLILAVSAVWILLVIIYITQFFGWSNLFLMMPDEFGGFMAGITLPLVIFWVAMAYIDRGTSFKKEAKFLRAYMNQLVYPEDGAPQTAKAMADAIRSQVVELQQVSKLAHEQTSQIKDAIKENVDDFAKLVSKLDGYSSHTIVELSNGVKFLMSNFENIVAQAQNSSNNLASINQKFVEDSSMIGDSLSELLAKIAPSMQDIKKTVTELKTVAGEAAVEINNSENGLKSFNQMAEKNFSDTREILNNQVNILGQVSEKAFESCNELKNKVTEEISSVTSILNKHYAQIDDAINSIGREVKTQSDEILKVAMSNIGTVSNGIKNELRGMDSMFDEQIDKIDSSMQKHSQEISGLVKTIDDRTDMVSKKFSSYSELINQELEKLMVRSSNLEDGVAMRVANLNGVADSVIASIQDVESSLAKNVVILGEKVAVANDDINSYIDNLGSKAVDIQELNDKVVDITDNINNRYKDLQKAMSAGLAQLQEVDKEINSSTENLLVQTAQSTESINQVSAMLQKQTSGITDASNIVVTQSQISEASLQQQQKYIADTASKVEFIKDELRRQIDELSSASESLESSAQSVSETLKSNIQKMLNSCADAVEKGRIINDNLNDQSNQFDTTVNKAITKVTQFENVLTKQLQNIDGVSKKVDDRSENIAKNLNGCTQKLDEVNSNVTKSIGDAISDFAIKAENINTISKNAAEYIDNVSSTIDNKVSDLNIIFRQQEADFYAYSNKMSDSTGKMVEIMKKQMNEISADTDKIYTKMVLLQEDTTNKADIAVSNLQKSVQKISEIGKSFDEEQKHTAKSIDAAMSKLSNIHETVYGYLDGFGAKVKDINDNVAAAVDSMNISSTKLKAVQQDLVKEGNTTWQKLNEQSKYMETVYAKLTSQGSDIANLFETQKNNISEVVNAVITQARLGEASMAQQYKYLTDATIEVAAKMQQINDNFKNNTGEIFEATNKMSYEFDVLGDRLLKACDSINKASKDSTKNIDQVSLRLNQCNDDLDTTIRQSVQNIGSVFNEYEKYLSGFNTVTAETSTSVVEINNLISVQSDKMVKISDDTKKLVDCFNTILNDTSIQLAARAEDAYEKVKDLGVKLKQLSNEMDDAAKLSATHLEKSGDKLRASVNEIAANAERISNNILSSSEVFIKQSQALSTIADSTAEKVNSSLSELVIAGKNFEEQGNNLMKDSSIFNEGLSAQIKNLADNTGRAEKALKVLNETYRDVRVDAFIKDSTKIMKVLENLSVDINRLLNPKGEDDLWKKFYNGDTQIFVRTLVKNISNSQISSIRKEFEKNMELRSLVIKYLDEFEALVEKSKNHEHAAVLMAVISGSDLGRLYYVLSKALNKLN